MKSFTVAKWEFIHRIKSKWFLISTILLPIIIIGFAIVPALLMQKVTEAKTFAVIDQTDWVSQKLQQTMTKKYSLKDGRPMYQWINLSGKYTEQSRQTADSLLSDEVITGYLIIPQDVENSLNVEYYARSLGNYSDLQNIEQNLSNIVMRQKMLAHDISPDLIADLSKSVNLDKYEVKAGKVSKGNELMAFAGPYFYIMLLFFAIFMSSQILMRSVLEERQNRVVEVLVSSVTPRQLMSGKILGLGAMGLVQVVIYLVVAQVVAVYNGMSIVSVTSLVGFIVYFIPGFLLFAAFYAAVGSMFTSEQEAQSISGFMSFIAIAPIIFLTFAMQNPNATIVKVLSYIPPFTPFFMIMRMNISSLPWWEYAATLSLLIVFVILTVRAAGKVFSTAILMYGKRPTMPEIWRWIRA